MKQNGWSFKSQSFSGGPDGGGPSVKAAPASLGWRNDAGATTWFLGPVPIYLKKSKLLALSENRVAHFWMIFGWFIIPPIQTRIWGIRIDPVMGVSLCHHGSLKPRNGWPSGGCGPSSSWRFTRASAFPKMYGIDELWWFYDGNNEIEWNWPWFTQMGGFQRHFLFPSLPTPEGSSCFCNSSALHLMVILEDTGIQDTSFWVIVSLGKLW